MEQCTSATEFWDELFRSEDVYSRVEYPEPADPVLTTAASHFGDVRGRRILDLGCGSGKASLFFASRGAHVISVDSSQVAIDNLAAFCKLNGIDSIEPRHLSALQIDSLGQFDHIFGAMILHHIEPFSDFIPVLKKSLKPQGRAFFWENSGASRVMIWCRRNLVGRFWIPKFGDREESPLTPGEIGLLRNEFDVRVEYPELLYFRMISQYLLRGHLLQPFAALDALFYNVPWLRRLSYRQYLMVSAPNKPRFQLRSTAGISGSRVGLIL